MGINGDLFTTAGTKQLAAHLRTVREFKGISRKEAAEGANVSLSWLQKLENVKNMNGAPEHSALQRYCEYLGVTVELQYNYSIKQ